MITCQKDKFHIPESVSYLNTAYMSPLLKEVELAGHKAITKKTLPYHITGADFFENTTLLKQQFADLVAIPDYKNVAVIPATSYGVSTVANNIILTSQDEVIVVSEQFPSHVYSWKRLVSKYNAKLITIKRPEHTEKRVQLWNENILASITKNTKVVALPIVHWSDGSLFDIKAIRKKTKEVGALLIIDGTQSIGALPFSVAEIQPGALICSGYKWLFGHYSIGLAYYADTLCNGVPLEENWINRKNSEDFSTLVNYETAYQEKAGRYNVGEMSNFALAPMLVASLKQIIAWKPSAIQAYTKKISKDAIVKLREMGCEIANENERAGHLFGIYLPQNINIDVLKEEFEKQQVYVSFRGSAVRVSCHLFNDKKDFDKLVSCFEDALLR